MSIIFLYLCLKIKFDKVLVGFLKWIVCFGYEEVNKYLISCLFNEIIYW